MDEMDKPEDPRRRILIKALTAGLFASGAGTQNAAAQGVLGSTPGRLPEGRSIYRLDGSARVNGAAASPQTVVRAGDSVETGANSELIFVVGTQAMILRGDSRLVLESPKPGAASLLISGLRLLTGKLLSVSRNSRMSLVTPTATIGIRGTGWYAESDPDQTYFCTCYGDTDIAASKDPDSRTSVSAKAHDRPLYIVANAARGNNIRNAPFINHTDQELMLIEALVGRAPPFVFSSDDYSGPRRDY